MYIENGTTKEIFYLLDCRLKALSHLSDESLEHQVVLEGSKERMVLLHNNPSDAKDTYDEIRKHLINNANIIQITNKNNNEINIKKLVFVKE
jgi:site-specific recombinase XerD